MRLRRGQWGAQTRPSMRAKVHPPRDGSKPEHTTMMFSLEVCLRNVVKLRDMQFRAQGGVCFYCHQPVWCHDLHDFAQRQGISRRAAALLQATAEHLTPRSEGGLDTLQNIVAACRFCNATRHRAKRPLSPETYGKRVRARLAMGKWHGLVTAPTKAEHSPLLKTPDQCPAADRRSASGPAPGGYRIRSRPSGR